MQSKKIYNFSPGPTHLPRSILEKAKEEFLDWHGKGYSITEMNHRSTDFAGMVEEAEKNLRSCMKIPEDFSVLWLQGGAYLEFSSVPLNLSQAGDKVSYLKTGFWSQEASDEAKKYCNVKSAWEGGKDLFGYYAPKSNEIEVEKDSSYFYYCDNETISGVEFPHDFKYDMPVVCDMSSNFGSRKINWDNFDVAFTVAQKNLGPAGLTIVMVRKSLLGKKRPDTPIMCDWTLLDKAKSFYNTPNVFGIYMAGLNLAQMNSLGIEHFEDLAKRRSSLIYDIIDRSDGFYLNKVHPNSRSRMNMPFRLPTAELDKKFYEQAESEGLINLKGHFLFGGCRASMYNAMEYEGAEALANFMKKFQNENAKSAYKM